MTANHNAMTANRNTTRWRRQIWTMDPIPSPFGIDVGTRALAASLFFSQLLIMKLDTSECSIWDHRVKSQLLNAHDYDERGVSGPYLKDSVVSLNQRPDLINEQHLNFQQFKFTIASAITAVKKKKKKKREPLMITLYDGSNLSLYFVFKRSSLIDKVLSTT